MLTLAATKSTFTATVFALTIVFFILPTSAQQGSVEPQPSLIVGAPEVELTKELVEKFIQAALKVNELRQPFESLVKDLEEGKSTWADLEKIGKSIESQVAAVVLAAGFPKDVSYSAIQSTILDVARIPSYGDKTIVIASPIEHAKRERQHHLDHPPSPASGEDLADILSYQDGLIAALKPLRFPGNVELLKAYSKALAKFISGRNPSLAPSPGGVATGPTVGPPVVGPMVGPAVGPQVVGPTVDPSGRLINEGSELTK